jgi:hypothetical protein
LEYADDLLELRYSPDPFENLIEAVRNCVPVNYIDFYPSYYAAIKHFCFSAFHAVLDYRYIVPDAIELDRIKNENRGKVKLELLKRQAKSTRRDIDDGTYQFFSVDNWIYGPAPLLRLQKVLEVDKLDTRYRNTFYTKGIVGLHMEANAILRKFGHSTIKTEPHISDRNGMSVEVDPMCSYVIIDDKPYPVPYNVATFLKDLIDLPPGVPVSMKEHGVRSRDIKKLPRAVQNKLSVGKRGVGVSLRKDK